MTISPTMIPDFGDDDLDPAEDMNLRPENLRPEDGDEECDVDDEEDEEDDATYRGPVLWSVSDEDGVTICESYPSEW